MLLNTVLCTSLKHSKQLLKLLLKMDFKVKVLIEHFMFFEYILLRF